jgi:hypothetical protein
MMPDNDSPGIAHDPAGCPMVCRSCSPHIQRRMRGSGECAHGLWPQSVRWNALPEPVRTACAIRGHSWHRSAFTSYGSPRRHPVYLKNRGILWIAWERFLTSCWDVHCYSVPCWLWRFLLTSGGRQVTCLAPAETAPMRDESGAPDFRQIMSKRNHPIVFPLTFRNLND